MSNKHNSLDFGILTNQRFAFKKLNFYVFLLIRAKSGGSVLLAAKETQATG